MKKRLILTLFLLVAGPAAIMIGGGTYFFVKKNIDGLAEQIKRDVRIELANRFKTFDALLMGVEREIDASIREALPALAADLLRLDTDLKAISADVLRSHLDRYGFDDVYVIDRRGIVVNTTFAKDLNLNLSALSDFLKNRIQSVFDSGGVAVDRIGFSTLTGVVRKYAYFNPAGCDYIVEISIDLVEYINNQLSSDYATYLFDSYFREVIRANTYVKDIDVFIVNQAARWSLLHRGVKLEADVADRLLRQGGFQVVDGDRSTVYSLLTLDKSSMDIADSLPVLGQTACTRVVYDFSALHAFPRGILIQVAVSAAAAALVAFLCGSWLLNSLYVNRILKLNEAVNLIAEGSEVKSIPVTGDDEIAQISESIRTMQTRITMREGQLHEQIIAKQRLSASLQESEEYHRNLFEDSPVALFLQDFTGVAERVDQLRCSGVGDIEGYLLDDFEEVSRMARSVVMSSVNRAARHLYKVESGQELGDLLGRSLVKSDHRHFIDQVLAFTDGADWYEGEGRNRTLDDEILYLLIRKNVISRKLYGLSRVLVAISDVSEVHQAYHEKERLEARLLQAHKMEAIGTLAGGIAHDFNNLLMGIQGRTSLMLAKLDQGDPKAEGLKAVEAYVQDATHLTRQLLGFARGGKFEVKPTDINWLVRQQTEMFHRTRKELTIRLNTEDELWTAEVDRGQMKQVLMNLYVNAWQAMPEGGTLHIETSNVVLDQTVVRPFNLEPGRYIRFSVNDTGVGMDKATQARIFEPFFSTKEKGRGTGLGLASVYGIVKNHIGFINVYSEPGQGTTFTVYLPASAKAAVADQPEPSEIVYGSGTVLLIDDEDMVLEVGTEMLELLGYTVISSESATDAISTYEQHHGDIDLVILDMIMPEMGGGEVYDRLKQINPDLSALLSSGYSINGKASEIMAQGCNGFIQKPFDLKRLSAKANEIIAG
ncbi:MAG: response regulator [Desulfobacterales bacterium]|nr:response regulator [Desulfobacterales bacterium]